jgi:hypothetical protein
MYTVAFSPLTLLTEYERRNQVRIIGTQMHCTISGTFSRLTSEINQSGFKTIRGEFLHVLGIPESAN